MNSQGKGKRIIFQFFLEETGFFEDFLLRQIGIKRNKAKRFIFDKDVQCGHDKVNIE